MDPFVGILTCALNITALSENDDIPRSVIKIKRTGEPTKEILDRDIMQSSCNYICKLTVRIIMQ
ncbi:hypothetical protein J6590_074884 [Homalodisca vitripennis]|nr:hypothetical protein J6590_074884 [Homalodisca vitripennis]